MNSIKVPFRNQSLAVYTNENTTATPILFLHGNSCSSKMWRRQFESPLGEKYYLLAFDFLGFGESGRSDTPESDYSITGLTEAVRTVIEYFDLKEYYIVGHSLGGHVIVQSLSGIQGCKGMISISAPPIAMPPVIGNIYLDTAPVGIMFNSDFTEEQLNTVSDNFFYSNSTEPEFFKDDFRKTDGRARAAIGLILKSDAFQDEVVTLSKTDAIRKAFICGEYEKSIRNDYYHTLDLPNTWREKLHVIPDASHCPQWERADEVNRIIDEFIQA